MAVDEDQVRHRPGVFKQQNKTHKTGRHRSKGQLQKEAKGRVNAKVLTRKVKTALRKQERRNQAQQIRKCHREEIIAKKRGRGAQDSPPFLVAVVPLCEGLESNTALELITTCDDDAVCTVNDVGICHLSVPRFKQRFSFITPEYGNLYGLLDAAKVADVILFLVSSESGVDKYGEHCLSCLSAQGMPASVIAIQGLKSLPLKKQGEVKKMIHRKLEKRFPEMKCHSLDTLQDALLILRTVGSQKLNDIIYRERRPHLLAENVTFELSEENTSFGTLKVSGYIRGQALSVNGLIHIPGWDSCQMIQIEAPSDPYPLRLRVPKIYKTDSMDTDVKILEHADPHQQESLQSEVVPDPMEAEQTWPTEEELAEAEAQSCKKLTKKVPRGTSEYQAAWIIDEHSESDSFSSEDSSDEIEDGVMSDDEDVVTMGTGSSRHVTISTASDIAEDDYETMSVTEGGDAKYDETIDIQEEQEMLERLKAARQDEMFPDEVDTPQDQPARVRFQKYRGLQSFRTSPWDPKENLPFDYARIYQFENFRHTKKRVLSELGETGALPGWFVTVHIADVPKTFMDSYQKGAPLVLFGLLRHEQKMSVLHFLLKRHPCSHQPIRSKERMIFHCGFRRFSACPIYSQHTHGTKHKFERFLQEITVATVYAPLLFPPVPVLMFKERPFGRHELVATGSLLSVNPDRIVAKRIVLSGHPFKINKKSAVIRYMFFNREDIMWFKPVELYTKWGRRGHIKEPLGTHGHMKCVFDGQLKSQDTVLMNLYKRVYPKWTYVPQVLPPGVSTRAPSVMTNASTHDDRIEELFD